MLFAVNGAVATPDELVVGENRVVLLLNSPEAAVPGAVKCIVTFDIGLL